MNDPEPSYSNDIQIFLHACPGPPMVGAALRVVALQDVEGIPGLSPSDRGDRGDAHRSRVLNNGVYIRTIATVAEIPNCRPEYLSETALKHGFSLSRALRWIRFSHGMALRDAGVGAQEIARRLGFNDRAGWHRFTVKLVGKPPTQLPAVESSFWAREAVRAVFLTAPKLRGVPAKREYANENMQHDNAGP